MRRKKSRRSKSKKFGNLWLVTAVLLILFIAGLYYLKDHGHRRPEHRLAEEKLLQVEKKLKAETHKSKPAAPTSSQPQFDFYNMLSQPQRRNSNNAVSETAPNSGKRTANPTNALTKNSTSTIKPTLAKPNLQLQPPVQTQHPAKNKQTATPATKYVLQVASLHDYNKVDEIKAELTLNGFNVSTEKIKKGDQVEYRINVGPYHSLKAAKKDQQRLRGNNMNSVLVRVPVK